MSRRHPITEPAGPAARSARPATLVGPPGGSADVGWSDSGTDTGELLALVYVSTAEHAMTAAELRQLLRRARERNAALGVTGVLLYSYGNFMQYLEGPAEHVESVYEVICASPLHKGIIELLREPIACREFDTWTMAFRDISAFGASDPPGIDDAFSRPVSKGIDDDTPARMLLRKFWNKGGVRSSF